MRSSDIWIISSLNWVLTTLLSKPTVLGFWLVLECAFFVWHGREKRRLEAPLPPPIYPLGPLETAKRTFDTIAALDNNGSDASICHEEAYRVWLSDWCLGPVQDIRRANVDDFFAWAFFAAQPTDRLVDKELMQTIVEMYEARAGFTIPPGRNPQICPMRLTLDPVTVVHRPAMFYAATWLATAAAAGLLRCAGFSRHPMNEGTMNKSTMNESTMNESRYWHRPARHHVRDEDGQTRALVFYHGVGVGILPYVPLLWGCSELGEDHDVFIVEQGHIAQQLAIPTVPSQSAMARAAVDMLAQHGHSKACFVGHSFGTLTLARLQYETPQVVARLVLLDPVCFLLSQRDICYNFFYRAPTGLIQMALRFFVATELRTVHAMRRNFWWYRNVLWAQDLPKRVPCSVLLSEHDDILPSASVARYIKQGASTVDVGIIENAHHGQLLFMPSVWKKIVATCRQ